MATFNFITSENRSVIKKTANRGNNNVELIFLLFVSCR